MTAISITEVTSGSLEGTGAFDQIMTAMQLRLEEEFSQGRITGDDYANVYLGAMTASMQQAVAFVLGKQTADAQAELTKVQVLDVIADTLNKPKQGLLLDKQVLQLTAQIANVTADTTNKAKEGQVLDGQVKKLGTEDLLLKHKIVTEASQYDDVVANVAGTGINVTGVIGKQKLLYKAQTDGFARDAEQKLAKLMVDTWNVRRTTDSGLTAAGTGLEDSNILAVVNKARAGVGA
jgi:hypothetical protein